MLSVRFVISGERVTEGHIYSCAVIRRTGLINSALVMDGWLQVGSSSQRVWTWVWTTLWKGRSWWRRQGCSHRAVESNFCQWNISWGILKIMKYLMGSVGNWLFCVRICWRLGISNTGIKKSKNWLSLSFIFSTCSPFFQIFLKVLRY